MPIPLDVVLPLSGQPTDYKLHLACWNQKDQPLDVFVRDRDEWEGWNRWKRDKNDFNRARIISFIEFYPQPNTWLFGGAFRVLSRGKRYEIEREAESEEFVGRLKVRLKRPGRTRSFRLERFIESMIVSELLPEKYSGAAFPGYEDISIDFNELEVLIRLARPDWKAALENVKGVYLVTDRSNGKRYVGSAYGTAGIWSRWAVYAGTGHGHNDELTQLVAAEGMEYARKNFRFALLEYRPMKTDDAAIWAREVYWKEALLSRVPLGYNKN